MTRLFAGHETTVVAIGWGALWLLANPDQRQALIKDPELLPSAVEEILRAPVRATGGIPRYASQDIELGGVTIREGDLVLLENGAANHDAQAFPDPDRFDIARRDSAHLTFGQGARRWPGSS